MHNEQRRFADPARDRWLIVVINRFTGDETFRDTEQSLLTVALFCDTGLETMTATRMQYAVK